MSFQSTAAKMRITGAEHEAAMKKAKFCYVILSNTFKGAAGVFSKELVKAASIKDKKKRRVALDTVTSQVIDELMTRREASMKKYAANKKRLPRPTAQPVARSTIETIWSKPSLPRWKVAKLRTMNRSA